MSRVAIHIDGAYFERVIGRERHERIDFGRLARTLAHGKEIMRTYLYDALPYLSHHPTDHERDQYTRKQRFFRDLLALPRFAVRQGKTVFRTTKGQRVFQQKKVDALLNVNVAVLAVKHSVDDMVLVGGDNDLVPCIETAKAEGVVVHLFHGPNADTELMQLCDERTLITDEFVNAVTRNGEFHGVPRLAV